MPKLNLPIPTLETSEGGSLSGPSSFRGYPLEAAYTLHRMGSHPPTPEQEQKMLSGGMGAHYTIALWCRFKVLDVMEPVGWEGRPDSPDTFEYTWSLGGKSAQVFYVTNAEDDSQLGKPWGLEGGFEEQAAYAAGIFDRAGQKLIMSLPHEKEVDGKKIPIDLSAYRGRWYLAIPGIPEVKTRLNDKCGYVQMLHESAPVVKAVDPSMVVAIPTGKKDEVRDQLAVWNLTDADGNPLGADYFVGLLGNWDMKKVGTFTPKGEKEEKDQKVLCLTHYEGRAGDAASSKTIASTASKKTTTTPASSTAAASTSTPSNGSGSLEDRVRAIIPEVLPATGTIPVIGANSLTLKVAQALKIKKADEAKAAADLVKQIASEAPEDAESAQGLVAMGMEVAFLHKDGKVERWSA